jgi:hypothetical protein
MLRQPVKKASQHSLSFAPLQELVVELDEQKEDSLLGGTSRPYTGVTYCIGDRNAQEPHGCY